MTAKQHELALTNARIISFLPVDEWLDTCRDPQMRRILLALLEVKRTMQDTTKHSLLWRP